MLDLLELEIPRVSRSSDVLVLVDLDDQVSLTYRVGDVDVDSSNETRNGRGNDGLHLHGGEDDEGLRERRKEKGKSGRARGRGREKGEELKTHVSGVDVLSLLDSNLDHDTSHRRSDGSRLAGSLLSSDVLDSGVSILDQNGSNLSVQLEDWRRRKERDETSQPFRLSWYRNWTRERIGTHSTLEFPCRDRWVRWREVEQGASFLARWCWRTGRTRDDDQNSFRKE